MENIIWSILFIIQTLKYILAENIFFKRDAKRKRAGIVGFLIYICLIYSVQITREEEKYLIMYGLALATTYMVVYQKKIEDFVHILLNFPTSKVGEYA